MTRDEFDGALTPVALAIGPISDARVDAIWSRFREESLPTWRYALESAQQSGRWPTPAGWNRYIDQAKRQTAAGLPGPGTSKGKACQCGGRLDVPQRRDLPIGITFPLVTLPEDARTPGGKARHQGENPTSWSWASIKQCTSCQSVYFVAGEDATISDHRGVRRVLQGEIRLATMSQLLELGASPSSWPQADPLPPLVTAYAKARAKLIGDAAIRKTLRRSGMVDRLLELADEFPDHADALVRDAAALVADSNGEGPPLSPEPDTHTSGPGEANSSPSAPERP